MLCQTLGNKGERCFPRLEDVHSMGTQWLLVSSSCVLGTEVRWKTAEGVSCSLKLFILSRDFQCRNGSLGTRTMCLRGKRLKSIDLLCTRGKEQGAPVWKAHSLRRDDGVVCLQRILTGGSRVGTPAENVRKSTGRVGGDTLGREGNTDAKWPERRHWLWWVAAAMAFRVCFSSDACLKIKQS